jgi:hypothetical protein
MLAEDGLKCGAKDVEELDMEVDEKLQGVEVRDVKDNVFLEIELTDNNIVNIKNVFTIDGGHCETQSARS